MKKFLIKLFLIGLPIIIPFILIRFISTDEESKIKTYSKLPLKNNIIFFGDSKSLVRLDYSILKTKFPDYNIVNLSIWAKNPKYIYSVYKDIIREKNISESYVVYNLTFRHILNRIDINYKGYDTKSKIKHILKKSLKKEYKFKYFKDKNHFIAIQESKFGDTGNAIGWYNKLEADYIDDFQTQLKYVDSLKQLFNKKNNYFTTTELPHRSALDSIYQKLTYYKVYRQTVDSFFPENLYFGYINSLENKKYWHNQDHLRLNGAKAFTEIFIKKYDSLYFNPVVSPKTKP